MSASLQQETLPFNDEIQGESIFSFMNSPLFKGQKGNAQVQV
jgi:hypothetical protein